jgi:hypothetical protein
VPVRRQSAVRAVRAVLGEREAWERRTEVLRAAPGARVVPAVQEPLLAGSPVRQNQEPVRPSEPGVRTVAPRRVLARS